MPFSELGANYEFERPNGGQILTGDLKEATPSPWSFSLRGGARMLLTNALQLEQALGISASVRTVSISGKASCICRMSSDNSNAGQPIGWPLSHGKAIWAIRVSSGHSSAGRLLPIHSLSSNKRQPRSAVLSAAPPRQH